ncbi:WD domain, G-beta repeat-containing protein [Spironucleus salmonicida]|uniref:WD domain, G-beta repeat-containing protein n=1 Tax=Spironucleus salmonicida TaxID=348837 RepID=V6M6J8_9EUKA|nr:WD domain, G-beta repeat-containing protein [Spironucleus salmonicida]|eukprot:EST49034.1 WD domain, G-beta repeat-containing protein [Spironucleus salmonicida]
MTTQHYKSIQDPYFVFGIQTFTALALSQSNEIIAYADAEYHVNLVDSEGEKLFTFLEDFDYISNLCFAQNDKFIISATKKGFQIFELETKRALFQIGHKDTDAHDSAVTAVCTVGNILVTGGQDTTVKQWYFGPLDDDLHELTQTHGSYTQQKGKWQLTFSQTLQGHKSPIYNIITGAGLVVSLAQDSQVKIYSIEQKQLKSYALINEHTSDVLSAAISPNGKLIVTGSRDNGVCVSTTKGELITNFYAHDADVMFVAFTGDGQFLLTADYDGVFRLYATPEIPQEKKSQVSKSSTFVEVTKQVNEMSNISMLAQPKVNEDKTKVPEKLLQYTLHDESMCRVLIGSQLPILITAQVTNFLRIWDISDLAEPALIKEIFSHTDEITDIKAAETNVILTSSKDGNFSILDYITGDKCAVVSNGGSVNAVDYHHKEQQIFASNSKYEVLGYQVLPDQLPQQFCTMKGHKGKVTEIIAADHMLITSGEDSYIMLWNIPVYEEGEIYVLTPFEKRRFAPANVTAMCFQNSFLVLAFADHSVRVFNVLKRRLVQKLVIDKAHAAQITGVQIINNAIISCAVDGTIKQFKLSPKVNKRYLKNDVLTSIVGSEIECFNRFFKSSSHICELQMLLPVEFGLPNCISCEDQSIVIGTTFGTAVLVNLEFEIQYVMATEGHETATKILMREGKVIVGFRKGMIQIWDLECEENYQKKVVVLVGQQLEEDLEQGEEISDLTGEVEKVEEVKPHFMDGRKLDLSESD